jgi:hypothetical protein
MSAAIVVSDGQCQTEGPRRNVEERDTTVQQHTFIQEASAIADSETPAINPSERTLTR